ncbi:MAG TPA: DUF4231 domain-containing protein [Cyanobacteria bacterium UBA11162]|nr:DUF4231 domain-containing protein [Cyanobacteria bacterium UBA11162]
MSETVEQFSSTSTKPQTLLTLKIVEYLCLAGFVGAGIITLVFQDRQILPIWVGALLAIFVFLVLLNKQLLKDYQQIANQSQIAKKAELYNYLLSNNTPSENNPIIPAREKALQYCQELIDDYKNTRATSRNIYYISQISTIILSGVTPILVLVDKLETSSGWIKWLPVIFPAIASIVASIVTSFPFQENWIAANTAVELLEAEQEKFILGVTQAYRCYDIADDAQRQQKAKEAVENFIVQVNNIHLKQIQATSETKANEEATSATQSGKSN